MAHMLYGGDKTENDLMASDEPLWKKALGVVKS